MTYYYTAWNLIFHANIYDCSIVSPSIVDDNASRKNVEIGLLYLILVIILYAIYIPFIIVMGQKKYLQYSSYKLMFILGVVDLFSLFTSGILGSYFQLNGYIYCSAPLFNFIVGAVAMGAWLGNNSIILLLVFNRCLDFSYPKLSDLLFKGNKTYIWVLIFPFPMMLWGLLFSQPPVYSSLVNTYAYYPYPGIFTANITSFRNEAMQFNNYYLCSLMVVVYIIFFLLLCFKYIFNSNHSIQTKTITTQLFFQALVICMLTLTADTIYVLMEYLTFPAWFTVIAHLNYVVSSGITGVIYLIMNRTLKESIREWFQKKSWKVSNTQTMNRTVKMIA